MTDFAAARRNMVAAQLRTNKVTDAAVLAAMGEIPRERFVDRHLREVAYVDEDIPVAAGRHLMEPMVLARMVQALAAAPGQVVLDVGCGTGYSCAVLARLATTVVALESDAGLARAATANLAELGVDNVVLVEGPLRDGHAAQAPYDAILIGGAVPDIPMVLGQQLAEGGRLCCVVGGDGRGRAVLALSRDGKLARRTLFDANIPPLPEFDAVPGFTF